MCILLPHEYRTLIIDLVSDNLKDGEFDSEIRRIVRENPKAFHNEESLTLRVFFHRPKQGIPHARWIHDELPVHLQIQMKGSSAR